MNQGDLRTFAASELHIDPKRFQFRSDANTKGVSGRLKGVSEWSPLFAGIILVWQDWAGDVFVVDGHHRVDLAKRLSKKGKPVSVLCYLIEQDSVSEKEARAHGILRNLAEGNVTAWDVAALLRSDAIPPAEMPKLPKNSAIWKQANAIAGLSQNAFNYAAKLKLDPAYIELIAREVDGESAQLAAMEVVDQIRPRDNALAKHVINTANAMGYTMQGVDLFGNQDVFANIKKRAELILAVEKALRTDKAVFGKLTKERDRIEGAGNRLAHESNESRLIEAKTMVEFINRQSLFPSETNTALTEATRDWIEGRVSKADAVAYVIDTAREDMAALCKKAA